METTKSLSCTWIMVDEAKSLIIDDALPSESINRIMKYLMNTLNLFALRVHQPASRKNATQITYEFLHTGVTRRLNQVISFPQENNNLIDPESDERYTIFDRESGVNPVTGEVTSDRVALFIKHCQQGTFKGLIEIVFKDDTKYPSEKDIDVLTGLKDIIFEQIDLFESKRRAGSDTDESEVLDYISGLHRYETFLYHLDDAIDEYVDDTHSIVVICSDITHFKVINENQGYRKGDELLRVAGQIIARTDNLIDACRFYSDNFIFATRVTNPDTEQIRSKLEGKNHENSLELQKIVSDTQIRVNSGVYIIRDPKQDAASAISYANTARKQAKVFKGVHCVIFTEEMIAEMRRSEELNDELPRAIKNHNLSVYYQPKISCDNETIIGAEALIRWRRDDGTYITPDQFIPEFESNGNIIQLDYFVYDEVFKFVRSRLDSHLPIVPVSMNVSRRHLENEDILFYIQHLITKYDMPTQYIEFELTESIYIDNIEPALHFMTRCNQMGIKVSMDDFGSGYSSLNLISEIPIDVLKIDGVFLHRGKELKPNDKIVLNNVIRLGKELNMVVLCEGVETREQVDFLKDAGCDIIQGFFFARPMNEDSFEDFILNSNEEDE
ncbi:MAG: GGDEF domain-containing phosphodiesterase [Eubacterium sp.]|nr:GGDEF domain-containing phosphodiesterase [Eubacterium sp.]